MSEVETFEASNGYIVGSPKPTWLPLGAPFTIPDIAPNFRIVMKPAMHGVIAWYEYEMP